MSSLWLCLSLLYALQSSVSSDEEVSLICNDTVEVGVGETVTLNCTIETKPSEDNCPGLTFDWKSSDGTSVCDWTKGICTWDNLTYVSLIMPHVTKEENITVAVVANCGMADSTIQVKLTGEVLLLLDKVEDKEEYKVEDMKDIKSSLPVIFGVFAAAIVGAMLCLLFRTARCRKIFQHASRRYSSAPQA